MAEPTTDVKEMLDGLYVDSPVYDAPPDTWTNHWYLYQDFILLGVLLLFLLFVIAFAKRQQRKVLQHNKDMFQKNHDMLAKSIENQQKTIEILEEISKKLEK